MDINSALRRIEYLRATQRVSKANTLFLDGLRRQLLGGTALTVAQVRKLKEVAK